ncbi:GIY-YIG nuclease family protein [Candidatus Parcubacteria bacterium]|nr:GIY-YIG nuclease family protein [Candidatus Parcubacteria bacterium]
MAASPVGLACRLRLKAEAYRATAEGAVDKFMFYVYLLKSLAKDRKYIGCTNDLKQRIKTHNEGGVKSTKLFKPWKLIYYESFIDKYDAFEREKELKKDYTKKRHLMTRLSRSLK